MYQQNFVLLVPLFTNHDFQELHDFFGLVFPIEDPEFLGNHTIEFKEIEQTNEYSGFEFILQSIHIDYNYMGYLLHQLLIGIQYIFTNYYKIDVQQFLLIVFIISQALQNLLTITHKQILVEITNNAIQFVRIHNTNIDIQQFDSSFIQLGFSNKTNTLLYDLQHELLMRQLLFGDKTMNYLQHLVLQTNSLIVVSIVIPFLFKNHKYLVIIAVCIIQSHN